MTVGFCGIANAPKRRIAAQIAFQGCQLVHLFWADSHCSN